MLHIRTSAFILICITFVGHAFAKTNTSTVLVFIRKSVDLRLIRDVHGYCDTLRRNWNRHIQRWYYHVGDGYA